VFNEKFTEHLEKFHDEDPIFYHEIYKDYVEHLFPDIEHYKENKEKFYTLIRHHNLE